jgi:hypothetical protein
MKSILVSIGTISALSLVQYLFGAGTAEIVAALCLTFCLGFACGGRSVCG